MLDELIVPPFYGTSEILTWEMQALLEKMDSTTLFKKFWGGELLTEENFNLTVDREFKPLLERLKKDFMSLKSIDARGMYGFYPVYTSGNEVCVLDPNDFHTEIAALHFCKNSGTENSTAFERLRPESDVVGIPIVCIGNGIEKYVQALVKNEGSFAMELYCKGFGQCLIEDLVRQITHEIKRALFHDRHTGCCVLFGDSELPNSKNQRLVFEFMGAEERLGVELTSDNKLLSQNAAMGIFIHE